MPTISAPRDLLEHLLAEVLTSERKLHPHWASLARRNRVLPVFGDFMGFWVIAMDGRLGFISDDAQGVVVPISDGPLERHSAHVALAQAAITYEELAPFVPPRPPTALTCTACDGRGLMSPAYPNIICECGGAGWLPPATDQPGRIE
jgi:hypothetical protein